MVKPGARSRAAGSATARSTFRLGALPLRVRLVALMVLLLLVALSLTSIATSAMMRRQLMDSVDRDLEVAAGPTAQQVLSQLFSHRAPGITNYVVRFMPSDGSRPLEVDPSGERLRPNIPNLTPTDPRVGRRLCTATALDGAMRCGVERGEVSTETAPVSGRGPVGGGLVSAAVQPGAYPGSEA